MNILVVVCAFLHTLARPVADRLELAFTFERRAGGTTIAVAAGGPSGLVTTVRDGFFDGSLSGLSCAAGGNNAGFRKVMMRGVGGEAMP